MDLIVSVGGDHTYLQSSSFAYDSSLPIMGINSQISTESGALLGNKITAFAAEADSHKLL